MRGSCIGDGVRSNLALIDLRGDDLDLSTIFLAIVDLVSESLVAINQDVHQPKIRCKKP